MNTLEAVLGCLSIHVSLALQRRVLSNDDTDRKDEVSCICMSICIDDYERNVVHCKAYLLHNLNYTLIRTADYVY